jgi:hypothetical protein
LVTASGNIRVNASQVWSNSTLFDGTTVETAAASSQIRLNNGAQLRLATASRAKVYQSRLVLEKGSGQLQSSAAYPIEARSLRIYSATPDALARVELAGSRQVVVSAMKGAVRVTNARGALVARLTAGNALSFEPQAGAAAPTKVSGCLLYSGGKLVVVDRTTNLSMPVQGPGLDKEIGNRVEVIGVVDPTAPVSTDGSQTLNVQTVKRIAKGGCGDALAAAAGKGNSGSGGAAGTGVSAKETIAIIGGVAAAGTVAGLAAAGTFTGRSGRPALSR